MLSRKRMLQMLVSFPVLGSLLGSGIVKSASGTSLIRPIYKRNFVTELGLRPFINARGTFTNLSSSLMDDDVLEAYNFMAQHFVNIVDLQNRVGERIAVMLKCEAAMVTAGAASALTLGTAASITGNNRDLIRALPDLQKPRREVIMQSTHRFGYDRSVRITGVEIVEVDSPQDMRKKINENTVMALNYNAADSHLIDQQEFVDICKEHKIVSFIDAAADVPPVDNLFKFTRMGFDLVTFSGGKGIRGPQSAGLLFGRKDLIEAAKMNHSPNADSIGRGMKVNKEEMVAMMVALETYLSKDHEKEWQIWMGMVNEINEHVNKVPGVVAEVQIPEGPANVYPGSQISWNENVIPITSAQLAAALRNGHPSIEATGNRDGFNVNVAMMRPNEAGIVGRRIREELERAKS
jgi:uncharacterized pyridoxal phosphate-dependent enzyme